MDLYLRLDKILLLLKGKPYNTLFMHGFAKWLVKFLPKLACCLLEAAPSVNPDSRKTLYTEFLNKRGYKRIICLQLPIVLER